MLRTRKAKDSHEIVLQFTKGSGNNTFVYSTENFVTAAGSEPLKHLEVVVKTSDGRCGVTIIEHDVIRGRGLSGHKVNPSPAKVTEYDPISLNSISNIEKAVKGLLKDTGYAGTDVSIRTSFLSRMRRK